MNIFTVLVTTPVAAAAAVGAVAAIALLWWLRRRCRRGASSNSETGTAEYNPILTHDEFGAAFDDDDEYDDWNSFGVQMQELDDDEDIEGGGGGGRKGGVRPMRSTPKEHKVPVGMEGLDDEDDELNG
mmetsp:Transcript_109/g.294  ORF Transcript_109/g.294 Transcript_109/m.294 type:complete len:128 (-) Transcript_109:459-842(-)|eukprot:CAMPEP_0194314392 /NCGR_PEP_ID=MMETSP0171-20130528/11241_1 /TAXON_ID=218684 /ORGANISM="Corethron pennatum, Strain L29A3" /LENGTH=127 /DNA_ID=CAMNT_0039069795 /DNA_START=133 /DNA_END=516 /DNA_ORIENTATION=-